jgi:hypothetical protein
MLTDITLEADLAAVCTRKFSSFSMEFDDSTSKHKFPKGKIATDVYTTV